jgi:hypothetical protein
METTIMIESKQYRNDHWEGVLQSWHFSCMLEIEDGHHHRTKFNTRWYEENVIKIDFFGTTKPV